MKFRTLLKLVAFAACIVSSLTAGLIIDTGPGGSGAGPALGNVGPIYNQALAAQFSVATEQQITGVSGWMANTLFPGTLNISIRSDVAARPGATLFQSSTELGQAFAPLWIGVSEVQWTLGPGTYWAVFSSPNLIAQLPWLPDEPISNPALFPSNFASSDTKASVATWTLFQPGDTGINRDAFGVQIVAEDSPGPISPVPEPATYGLMGSIALVGLAFWRRGKRVA